MIRAALLNGTGRTVSSSRSFIPYRFYLYNGMIYVEKESDVEASRRKKSRADPV